MDANEKLNALLEFHGQMEGKNHFELLGIDEDVNDAGVRSAYHGLLKNFNADYFQKVTDPDARKAITEVNSRLREAYNALMKKSSREMYIAQLHGGGIQDEEDLKIDIADVFEADKALNQARSLMERGDFTIAKQKLERAFELDPKSLEAEVRLSYCNYMLMDVDENGKRVTDVVEHIRKKLTDACPELPRADFLRVYLGNLEKLEGNEKAAKDWFKQALEINPDNIAAKREERMMKAAQEEAKNAPKGKTTAKGAAKSTAVAQEDDVDDGTILGKIKKIINKLNSIQIG